MSFKVFIQNEAGSSLKNHHDEKKLLFVRSETVRRAYPFPYGFVIGTASADGDCLDCFVITSKALKTGEIVECQAIGLMEQTEDGLPDNNVLARLIDERPTVTTTVTTALAGFVDNVFKDLPGRTVVVGRFLGAADAEKEISQSRSARVVVEPMNSLTAHAEISITFIADRMMDVSTEGAGGFTLRERQVVPRIKDYDAVESPGQWAGRYELEKWGLIGAYQGNERVGGAVIAFDTRQLDLLEGRNDLALLWDIRVRPDVRREGVGSDLLRAVEKWASDRSCRQLKVETQNVNVPACRFYARQGFRLVAVNYGVYRQFPEEIQLIWLKDLHSA